LRCAYPISGFPHEEDGHPFLQICAEHSNVIPGENYTNLLSEEERLRTIAHLQQKAQALETEVEERKKAEHQLRLHQERLRLTQAAAGIGSWELDLADETMSISPEAAEMLGYSRSVEMISFEDLLGLMFFSTDRERVRAMLMKAARINKEFATEFRVRKGTGARSLLARGKVFHNGGAPVVVGVLIDITKQGKGAPRKRSRKLAAVTP
jgi:PAS domain S-box-containing protein